MNELQYNLQFLWEVIHPLHQKVTIRATTGKTTQERIYWFPLLLVCDTPEVCPEVDVVVTLSGSGKSAC
jgi:hypothetical protein